jgi:hypothetical protein
MQNRQIMSILVEIYSPLDVANLDLVLCEWYGHPWSDDHWFFFMGEDTADCRKPLRIKQFSVFAMKCLIIRGWCNFVECCAVRPYLDWIFPGRLIYERDSIAGYDKYRSPPLQSIRKFQIEIILVIV